MPNHTEPHLVQCRVTGNRKPGGIVDPAPRLPCRRASAMYSRPFRRARPRAQPRAPSIPAKRAVEANNPTSPTVIKRSGDHRLLNWRE